MTKEKLAVFALRVFLGVLFIALIPFELLSLPGQFRHMALKDPDFAYMRWPMTIITVFWVVCVQVIVFATWKLLTLVTANDIFSKRAFKWVNTIITSIVCAWLVIAGLLVYIGTIADDPGILVLMLLLLVGVGVVGLLMFVMRALLVQATSLQTEMEAVV